MHAHWTVYSYESIWTAFNVSGPHRAGERHMTARAGCFCLFCTSRYSLVASTRPSYFSGEDVQLKAFDGFNMYVFNPNVWLSQLEKLFDKIQQKKRFFSDNCKQLSDKKAVFLRLQKHKVKKKILN